MSTPYAPGKVCVIAAHPDDEILGCGGTSAKFASLGTSVFPVIVATGATSRPLSDNGNASGSETATGRLRDAGKNAAKNIGTETPIFLNFDDQKLDNIPFLSLTHALEQVLSDLQPGLVLTHSAVDLNLDHRLVNQATMTACRPLPGQPVREIWCFETLSSTEWSSPEDMVGFRPNLYMDISDHLEQKLTALDAYEEEVRLFPHPRSREGVEHLARLRGTQAGLSAAEAFCCVRRILTA